MSKMLFRVGSVSPSSSDDNDDRVVHDIWKPQTPHNTPRLNCRIPGNESDLSIRLDGIIPLIRTQSSVTASSPGYRSLGRERCKEKKGISFLKRFNSDLKAIGIPSKSGNSEHSKASKSSVFHSSKHVTRSSSSVVNSSEKIDEKYSTPSRVQLRKSDTVRTGERVVSLSHVTRSSSDFNLHTLLQKPPVAEYQTASLRLDRRNKTTGLIVKKSLQGPIVEGIHPKSKGTLTTKTVTSAIHKENTSKTSSVHRDQFKQQILITQLKKNIDEENPRRENQSVSRDPSEKFRLEDRIKCVLGECIDSRAISKSNVLPRKYSRRSKKRQQGSSFISISKSVSTDVDVDKYVTDEKQFNRDWYCFNDRLVNPHDDKRERCTSADARCSSWVDQCEGSNTTYEYHHKLKSGQVERSKSQRSYTKTSSFRSKASEFWDTIGGYVDPESSNESNLDVREVKIRKLRRELDAAQEKVYTLTTQLNTNAHVVAAFEQSLSNMTQRLQKLSTTSQQKDSELNELRVTIESLRLQGRLPPYIVGETTTTTSTGNSGVTTQMPSDTLHINRHVSVDSVTSLNSFSSACSGASHQSFAIGSSGPHTGSDADKKKAKKSWLRSSFSKAFSRKKSPRNGSLSDVEADTASLRSDTSTPNSPMMHLSHTMSMPTTPVRGGAHLSTLMTKIDSREDAAVFQLKQELHEKDLKLTDIQLDALSSAHQLEQMCESMNRLKSEMSSLKADNDRLQKIISLKEIDPSFASSSVFSQSRLSAGSEVSQRDSGISGGGGASDYNRLADVSESEVVEGSKREGRRILLIVRLANSTDTSGPGENVRSSELLIGAVNITESTKWDVLDNTVRKAFKEYMLRMESGCGSMGLTSDSISNYKIGETTRTKTTIPPDVSPSNCIHPSNTEIIISLKGTVEKSVDSLVFESLIPKAIIQRYVALLLEHRRIILCGPSGTGKTYLAQKLAEYIVLLSGKEVTAGSIATFNVDHKSGKELRQYLANIADQCEHSGAAGELPSIIILDNLHHAGSLGEVFNGFLSIKHQRCPYIIGTMTQPAVGGSSSTTTTNLQLHHNFRWVLCANHTEPTRGFLGRYLRRRLVEQEIQSGGTRSMDLVRIVDWLPKVWQHLNRFLETHSSSDVTIGPRLFLSCPMDPSDAQVWFTDLWNYSVVPYLLEAVREGLQTYGHRAAWEDPVDWVVENYPWSKADWTSLHHLRHEDVGYDPQVAGAVVGMTTSSTGMIKQTPVSNVTQSDAELKDPMVNMLLRLQEAASYSSPQSNESDSTTSVDGRDSNATASTALTDTQKASFTSTETDSGK